MAFRIGITSRRRFHDRTATAIPRSYQTAFINESTMSSMSQRDGSKIGRRTVLVGIGTGALIGLAGCLGGGEEPPEPVSLDDEQSCDWCGMVIEEHPGPKGQIYFADESPDDRDGPAWFCSGVCTYRYRSDAEDMDWEPVVTYLTDYSGADYDVEEEEGDLFITALLEAERFVDEADLSFVVGSDVRGAMGPDLIPFSDGDDANAFAEQYGGDVIGADEITDELIESLGM